MYYKVWTVGNGGIRSDEGYFSIRDCYDGDDDAIEEILYEELGSLPDGVRSIGWVRVGVLPDDEIANQLAINEGAIKVAKERIRGLQEMKKAKQKANRQQKE